MRSMVSARRVPFRLPAIGIAVALVLLLGPRPAAADADGGAPEAGGLTAAADAGLSDAAAPLPADVTLAPELPPSAPLTLEAPAPAPAAPLRSHRPFYRKDWFWGAVGVVVLTAAIVLLATTSSSAEQPPPTTLGNMRAF
jgi:hypothetical protein